ncbi:oxidoreductase (plasmid) [Persicobacter psychrovividus]|uniref:Oxidoreductase n=2 Tax=Persicobacter psychrovividus TaxID=387638 RepID=A0ABM7VL49_9BACT|nr:oxidoreductase [Persicobacter psychrovividus]
MTWGKWGAQFNTKEYLALIEACLENGIDTFDHADIYGNYSTEQEFGKALADHSSLRSSMKIITKCGICMPCDARPAFTTKHYDYSAKHIRSSVEQSLTNFNTDYLDFLLLHRPSPLVDTSVVAEVFDELKQEGKVLHFGVSNFTPSQFEHLNSLTPLSTNQVECNLLKPDAFTDGTFDQARQKGYQPTIWSPLGGGKLFKAEKGERENRIIDAAQPIMEKYGVQLDQLLLIWLCQHPALPVPVLGTTKIQRLKDALEGLQHQLTTQEWFVLYEAYLGEEIP